MLSDTNPPKTKTRTFKAAQFEWEQELGHGERLPWQIICERWNNWPLTEP
jgi:hypothetical protein